MALFNRYDPNQLAANTSTGRAQAAATAGGGPLGAAKQRAIAAGNVARTGYGLGSLRPGSLYGERSHMRPDQTNAERIAEQRGNFFYGGTATGAQDAIGSLRGNMGAYTDALGQSGSAFMDQSGAGSGAFVRGARGLDNAAWQLGNLAMQGPGPSQAQAQLAAQNALQQQQALALAGSGRGQGGGAGAFRQVAAQNALQQGQMNANAAVIRAQEEDAWRRTQAGMLAQAGGLYGQGAQLGSGYATGMGGLGLGAQQAGAQTQLGVEQGAHGINMGSLQGSTGYESLLNQIYGISEGVAVQNAQLEAQKDAATWGAIGTGVTTAATLAAMASDINAKTNIVPAGPQLMHGPVDSLPSGGEIQLPGGPLQKSPEQARAEQENKALRAMIAGQLGQFTTQIGQASDVRAKTGVALAPQAALSAVEQTNPWQYQYKDPGRHGQGTHYGPMAQELAQTPVGRSTLMRMPDGTLGVDTGRLSLVNTAAQAAKAKEDRVRARGLEQRLRALEEQYGRTG